MMYVVSVLINFQHFVVVFKDITPQNGQRVNPPPPTRVQSGPSGCDGVTCDDLSNCIKVAMNESSCCPKCTKYGCVCEGYQLYDCKKNGFRYKHRPVERFPNVVISMPKNSKLSQFQGNAYALYHVNCTCEGTANNFPVRPISLHSELSLAFDL